MITTIQFKTLDDLYKFYNDAIFNSELLECMSRCLGNPSEPIPQWLSRNRVCCMRKKFCYVMWIDEVTDRSLWNYRS